MTPTVLLVPFDETDFQSWLKQAIPAYASSHVEDGSWSADESLTKSAAAHSALLPNGVATPGHTLVSICLPGEEHPKAGHLWWAEVENAGQTGAYVYDVEVAEHARRRGVARAAFAELERVALTRGLRFISLHVFGHNRGARRLYEELGFEPTNLTLRKEIR